VTSNEIEDKRDLVEFPWDGVKSTVLLSATTLPTESEPQAKTAKPVLVDPAKVVLEVVEELTEDEITDRQRLELKVERAFSEAGRALLELRDRRLYRSTHKTFEEYCRGRFGMHRSRLYQLIDATKVVDNLSKCLQFVDIFPTNESQCRELAKLEPDEQPSAWLESCRRVGGGKKVPPASTVKSVVREIKELMVTPPIHYQQGEVVMVRGMGNPDLRKYDGQWTIVLRVNEYTVTVYLIDREISVKPHFLEEVDPKYWAEIKAVNERIGRLQQFELDPIEDAGLEVLRRRTCFTPRQMIWLERMEQDYGIERELPRIPRPHL
jgi:hypothetical protein